MNNIDITQISDPSRQQPFTGKSLEFLQNATKEGLLALVTCMIGSGYDSSKAYVLYGGDAYGTNQYRAGYILWAGELYYTEGKLTTTAFVNVPVMTITVTNDAVADPLTFTDGSLKNVHKIRRLVLSDALAGSGTFNLSAAIYINTSWIAVLGGVGFTGGWSNGSTGEPPARFKKQAGYVELEGFIFGGTASPPSNAFTLPVGFRPSYIMRFIVIGSDAPIVPIQVTISTAGVVNISGSGTQAVLTGIRFSLD